MKPYHRLKKFDFLKQRGINLLAVSKGQEASSVYDLAVQGQVDFGESRLQEALKKIDALKHVDPIRWHFVGHLQANKVRGVVKAFDVIHSIDSFKLAERLARIAGEEKKRPTVFFQVKFRKDPNKSGFSVNGFLDSWNELKNLPNINVAGLMTISPIDLSLQDRKIMFAECRSLADKLSLKDCSMGMSRDWEEAVQAGATWIRLGSALFEGLHETSN